MVKLFESIRVKDSLILNPSFVVSVTILLSPLDILIFKPSIKFWSVAFWISNSFFINANELSVIVWSTSLRCAISLSSISPVFVLGDNSKLISKGNPILSRSVGLSNCAGNVIEDDVVHGLFAKAPSPIDITLSGMFSEVNAAASNANSPIWVIESGIVIAVIGLPENALLGIRFNDEGMLMLLIKFVTKALSPNVFNFGGKTTCVKSLWLKACAPIFSKFWPKVKWAITFSKNE